jgi:hypothetical protein
MKEYDFALTFELENPNIEPDIYTDDLYKAGCDDAVLGIGKKGFIALDFIRESDSAYDAVSSAIANVKTAISKAKLIHVSPDLVGVKELSVVFDCTRQNIQKYVNKPTFPKPFYRGYQALWHLETVLIWFINNGGLDINQELIDIATLARHINFNLDNQTLNPKLVEQAQELISL